MRKGLDTAMRMGYTCTEHSTADNRAFFRAPFLQQNNFVKLTQT